MTIKLIVTDLDILFLKLQPLVTILTMLKC